MAPKRPHENDQEPGESSRARKKQKTADARTIHVQPGSSAGASFVANSMVGLPGAIDVEKFTEARSFEIAAMQTAMQTAKNGSTQRAWQALPRSLRRRAASHDVRRVPVRLREKARAEMDPLKRKALGRKPPNRGQAKQIKRTQSFLKRQRDKTWLETHLWHAKRMHMKNIWGYRLSETPTEKSFRPSHRASVHGSILHDASYIATVAISGKQSILEKMLSRCCDCQGAGPGAVRYTLGSRVHETHLYEPDAYPFGIIAPISVIWRPLTPPPSHTSDSGDASTSEAAPKKRRRRKAKEPDITSAKPKLDSDTRRTLWIRFHPSAWQDAWDAIQKAASITLGQIRRDREMISASQNEPTSSGFEGNPGTKHRVSQAGSEEEEEDSIELVDLRSQMNCFEIMGPRSTQVLLGALKLVGHDDRPILRDVWSQLKDLQSPGSVPRGMIIGAEVQDPRLNFPPKNVKMAAKTDGGLPSASQAAGFTVYPNATLARSNLWDAIERDARPRFKKKDLDDRRRQNLISGTALQPLRQDDVIPLMLIQRTISPYSTGTSTPSTMHGWTLLLPPHWGMPFFTSLTYTGTRVAGLRERRTQAFEAFTPDFPFDYPGSPAYKREGELSARVERERWERKPPAKRVNWEAVGTRSPWRADWEVVLGLEPVEEEGMLATQREDGGGMRDEGRTRKVWLFRGPDMPRMVQEAARTENPVATLLAQTMVLRAKRGLLPLSANSLKGAVVPVQVHVKGRGAPDDLAALYALEPNEKANEMEVCAGTSPIIGYVTTGSFSLSQGKGAAIGAISLVKFMELTEGAVKVKDRESAVCRAARVEILAI